MTNQTNSGEKESSADNVETQLQTLNKIYEEYIGSIGLNFTVNDELLGILNMSSAERDRLSPDELSSKACVLAQNALYIQGHINKHTVVVEWAQQKIDFIAARHLKDYDKYTPYEAKKLLVIQQNSYAKKLFDIKRLATIKLQAISYLPAQIRFLAERLEIMRLTKVKER